MIGKDPNGKTWYCEFYYRDPITKERKRHKKRGFPTKREAKQYEAEKKILSTEPERKTSKTFREVAELQINALQQNAEVKRRKDENFRIRFSQFYDVPITDIRKADLIQWRADLAADDRYSTQTKNNTIVHVKSVFSYASEVYDLPNTGAVLKSLKKTNEEILNEEMQTWTPEEFSQFLTGCENPLYRLFFEFLYWTGCRRGEALALQKSDFTEDWIYIHQSIRDFKNGLKPTKTRQNRKIKNDPQLWEDLQPLLAEPGSFLFGGERSLPVTSVQRYFTAGIQASGVKPIRLHDLRHSHATLLINAGVNIVAVSKRLGHATINQTLKTYTHLLEETDNDLLQKITELHR